MFNLRLKVCLCAILFFLSFQITGKAYAQKSLKFGVHPYLPATELLKRFTPLAEYISNKTGKTVTIEIARDYSEHIDHIGKNMIDIAYMGPASYVKLVETYGKRPILARLEINGKPTFQGFIIIAKDSAIRTLSDVKGKRFAFGDPDSTMSHLVPRYMLLEAGVDIEKDGSYKFLYSHHNVALGVLMGDFDVGAVKEEVFYKYKDRGLKILAETPEFSEHLFVTRSRLPDKTVNALREALYKLRDNEDGRAVLTAIKKGMTGLVPATDKDYDNLRAVLQGLKKRGIHQ